MSTDIENPVGPVTLAILGCGQRGSVRVHLPQPMTRADPFGLTQFHIQAYAEYSILDPSRCKVVAIAEPRPQTRALFIDGFRIDPSLAFETWERFHKASAETIQTARKRLADAVLVTVQDNMHAELVVAFAAQGYDILCEKPLATSVEHCLQIEEAVKKAGTIFGLGHGVPPPCLPARAPLSQCCIY